MARGRRAAGALALCCVASCLLLAVVYAAPESDPIKSTAAAAGKASQHASTSECGKQCFAAAKKLGMEKVAADSLACFMTHKGKMMSHYDCCDKAELLLGARGKLASCLCCPEFAKVMLGSIPYGKINVTPEEYLEKLNLCRVPIGGTPSCSARAAKESAHQATESSPPGYPTPLIQLVRFTGVWPYFGFKTPFDATTLAEQGAAAVRNGSIARITTSGASPFYNDYVTGFVMYAERETPRYAVPARTALPPLPEAAKEDLAWVANLRRGPYPDLITGRPRIYSPKMTDTLQNGQVASMSPAPSMGGVVPLLRNVGSGGSSPTN